MRPRMECPAKDDIDGAPVAVIPPSAEGTQEVEARDIGR